MKKRFVALISVFVFLFTSIAGRCAYIAFSGTYEVSDTYNSYTVQIGRLNPYIYDRRGEKLNNNSVTHIAVIRPNEKCMAELDKLFTTEEIKEITEELSKGYPITRVIDKKVNTQHIQIFDRIEENSDDMLCRHLLDYQCSGLEKYTNYELGELYVNFPVDAQGHLLSGNTFDAVDNNYSSTDGVIISIDKRIQQICEDAAKPIPKGSIVVMDTETSQLLASVSIGDDYNNRALSGYAIGSVFKLVVCVAALEKGITPLYNCNNSIKIADTVFSCQNNRAHGMQTMKQALANSCNCYFVNLAMKLGADTLYATAKSLGFGEDYHLFEDWAVPGGNMPSRSALDSVGELSLLGFGQGLLTDSPVHFASVISCIANGGNYNYPTLDFEDVKKDQTISEKTADAVLEYMHYVVTDGTGVNANYKDKTAGKTATAQSGIYNNGSEVLNTWFAGIYPIDKPKYAIVVMCEDGKSGAGDCCPVFRTIVEKLEKM